MKNTAILLTRCPDRKGEVAAIDDFVCRHGENILRADEHSDQGAGLFRMRVEFDPKDFDSDLGGFSGIFVPIAETFRTTWRLAQSSDSPRTIIVVSKYSHCLADLLPAQLLGQITGWLEPRHLK